MRMPNAEHAVVDMNKLTDYCLNTEHPRGRHKAHTFASALGLTINDAEKLQKMLLFVAQSEDAMLSGLDQYGQRYTVDFVMAGPTGDKIVRSAWIIRSDEDFPRFVSCYVL